MPAPMNREKDRIVRLLSCDLTAPRDITNYLLDYVLAWIWIVEPATISLVKEKGPYKVEPTRGMYDFGLDDDVPSDWLVWTEHSDKSVNVVHDLRVLHGLGVRGNFVINVVGTLIIEKWKIMDHFIATHGHEVTFDEKPDAVTPLTPVKNLLEGVELKED